jgi:hypothetical protein
MSAILQELFRTPVGPQQYVLGLKAEKKNQLKKTRSPRPSTFIFAVECKVILRNRNNSSILVALVS